MLCQPNFAWCGRRTWNLLPYGLGLLNACLKQRGYDSWLLDPNAANLSEEEVRAELRRTRPDVVGITTFSSEYLDEPRIMSRLVKEELPETLVILGGALPTVWLEAIIDDPNIDYHVTAEGEYRLPALLDALNRGDAPALATIDGLASAHPVPFERPSAGFVEDLDALPVPDYGGLDLADYTEYRHVQAHTVLPRQWPYETTITSRGCPYRCCFCAGRTVSGARVRLRSAAHVLAEVDLMLARGTREVIFLDDHFLANRDRALAIMAGIHERDPQMTWKCVNVTLWHLDEELLAAMLASGCNQITVSVESGNQQVLRDIVHKPIQLPTVAPLLARAQAMGFEIAVNFVLGFPGETWEQIRETVRFAEALPADLVLFHIATPMPRTELWDICQREGCLAEEASSAGYTTGRISTDEFSPQDLQILRAYEWDRINFASPERRARIARMSGLTLDELDQWRRRSRRQLGRVLAGQA